jgi:hypothetical protein
MVLLPYIMSRFGKIKHIQEELLMNVIMVLKRSMEMIRLVVNVLMERGTM